VDVDAVLKCDPKSYREKGVSYRFITLLGNSVLTEGFWIILSSPRGFWVVGLLPAFGDDVSDEACVEIRKAERVGY